jgi:hypothetical protein
VLAFADHHWHPDLERELLEHEFADAAVFVEQLVVLATVVLLLAPDFDLF